MKNKTLILVDGSYYMFRAYHALPNFTNSNGEPTGVIYGVMNMLKKLVREHAPDYFAVVFDASGKTFRNDMYAEYKANRPPPPEELVCQIKPMHEIVAASGFPLLMIEKVEADDVIGTLAKQAEASGLDCLISSGDKDLAQLVNGNIRLINTMQDVILDSDGVREKFGIGPDRIIDYLALVGDSIDNIPGIPKVGPKTAVKWLHEYGDLDQIIKHRDEIKGKVGEYLRENLDQLALSRQLVTLNCDVELDYRPEDLQFGEPQKDLLREHYNRWEFNSWLKELENDSFEESTEEIESEDEPVYSTVLTKKEFNAWLKKLKNSELFALDTETTSLDYMQARIVGFSFAVAAGEAAYVPVAHDYEDAPRQLDRDYVLERLKSLLEDPDRKKLGHNIKYDMEVLANHGIRLDGIEHDTMLESYTYNSTASRHDMDSLAEKYLGISTIHYEDVAGKGSKQIPFNHVSIETAGPYAAEDADITLQLHQHLYPKLKEHPPLEQLYFETEMPLLPVLARMERHGVIIDRDMLDEQSTRLESELQELEMQAHELAGESFNIGSPKQIQVVLYEKMQLPVLAKTPKGQPSTAESALQELALEYELPKLILDYRSLSKLKSTYTDKLPQQINPDTGRIHTSYHQAVAATGRLSSSDPNLQNIPIRTEAGRRIRSAFVAPEGYELLAADYSQIELRIMAHLSGDKGLLDAFANGEDIHRATAAEVFETGLDEVSDSQRRSAKAINFGLIYGMSAFGLAKQLGIERSAARAYIDRYFDRYPGVKKFMDRTREQAREDGYVETLFHRRLYLPEINSRNAARRQYAERTAINAPMQGTAADIIKRAMIAIDRWLQESRVSACMIMQVHDELVLEVEKDQLDTVKNTVRELMIKAADLDAALEVDIGSGPNWDLAH
ncbi:MAG: DNA polymerase I [Gammaproteobacteria bacterium]|nr:DNA polymerase I [Gammaproteobacteria bacterium]